jgi:AcrR family transcriptional regulator
MSEKNAFKSAPKRVSAPSAVRRQSRSERTRQNIKEATVSLLNDQNYFDLTITEICQRAGVATGGFYFHYEKKADLIGELLREHNKSFWCALMTSLDYRDLYSAVFAASTALVKAYFESPGLVRCFNQLAMTDRVYVKLWEDAATAWASRLAELIEPGGAQRDIRGTNAYGLLAFADLLLFDLWIEREPSLIAAAGAVDEVTENLAVLWYRGLTGQSPDAGRLALPNRKLSV